MNPVVQADNIGSTAIVLNQHPTKLDLKDSGLGKTGIHFEIKTTNGQGGTPTSPGVSKNYKLRYAFCNEDISPASDAVTLLINRAGTITCPLPDSNSSAVAGQRWMGDNSADPIRVSGRFLYLWGETDAFTLNGLIDVLVNIYAARYL